MNRNKKVKPPIQNAGDLYSIFLETLKEVTSDKGNFSPKEFSKCLASRKDVRQIIKFMQTAYENEEPKEPPTQLKNHVEVLTKERKKLHAEINKLKKERNDDKDFQLRFAVAMVRVSQRLDTNAYVQIMKKNQEMVQNDTVLREREKLLTKLKKQLSLHEEKNGKTRESDRTPTLSIPKTDVRQEDILQRIKDTFLEDIDEARMVLDEDSNNTLMLASQHIRESEDIEYIVSQGRTVFHSIINYISGNQSEKEKVTNFIKEISVKLINLEKAITNTHSTNQAYHKDDAEFHEQIGNEITSVREEVQKHSNLEDLKSSVIEGFERISSSIKVRQLLDLERNKKGDTEHQDLKSNFEQVLGSLLEQNKILKEQSLTDPLTGIFNRRVFDERIAGEMERFSRYKTPFSLILFDVDDFKGVNDQFGHEAGDRAMKAITSTVKNHIRKTDVFARYGGDEFILILTQTGISKSLKVAEKLHDLVQKTSFGFKGKQVPITISMGVTEVNEADKNKEVVITRADSLLYKAKESGRNLVISDRNNVK